MRDAGMQEIMGSGIRAATREAGKNRAQQAPVISSADVVRSGSPVLRASPWPF